MEEFKKEIEDAISKHFPDAWLKITNSSGFGKSISVDFGLEKDIKNLSSGIRQNDPAFTTFMIRGFDKDFNFKDKLSVEMLQGGLKVKPDPGSHMAMKILKVWLGKRSGPKASIVKYFDGYFSRLKKLLDDNEDNLMGLAKSNLKKIEAKLKGLGIQVVAGRVKKSDIKKALAEKNEVRLEQGMTKEEMEPIFKKNPQMIMTEDGYVAYKLNGTWFDGWDLDHGDDNVIMDNVIKDQMTYTIYYKLDPKHKDNLQDAIDEGLVERPDWYKG